MVDAESGMHEASGEHLSHEAIKILEHFNEKVARDAEFRLSAEGLSFLKEALSHCTVQPEWIHYTIGDIAYALGRFDEVKKAYAFCLDARTFLWPSECLMLTRLAAIHEAEGDVLLSLRYLMRSFLRDYSDVTAGSIVSLCGVVAQSKPDLATIISGGGDLFEKVAAIRTILFPDVEGVNPPPPRLLEDINPWRVARFPARAVPFLPPCFINSPLPLLQEHFHPSASLPPMEAFNLMNSTVFVREGQLAVYDDVRRCIGPLSTARIPLSVAEKPEHVVEGTVALLVDRVCIPNYCHWLYDWIPRIRLLRGMSSLGVDKWLVYSLEEPFQLETLSILGIPRESVIEMRDIPVVRAQRLLALTDSASTHHHPARLGWEPYLSFIRSAFPPAPGRGGEVNRRIYISREGARSRRVEGERELLKMLVDEFGFESCLPHKLTFQEQVNLFSEACCVVAPHGAGVSNIAFCPRGASIIEIFSPLTGSPAYYWLSHWLGHRHAVLTGYHRGASSPGDLFESGRRGHGGTDWNIVVREEERAHLRQYLSSLPLPSGVSS